MAHQTSPNNPREGIDVDPTERNLTLSDSGQDTRKVEEVSRFQTVDLSARGFSAGWVRFLRAEAPSEPSPFALVRYAIAGEEQSMGLRLDMDKTVFLDQPEGEASRESLQRAAFEIADAVREAVPLQPVH
jgi:hypothetical protein